MWQRVLGQSWRISVLANLVPRVSHLTAPWGERGETVLTPGGCKMRLRDWHLFVVRYGSNYVWSGTRWVLGLVGQRYFTKRRVDGCYIGCSVSLGGYLFLRLKGCVTWNWANAIGISLYWGAAITTFGQVLDESTASLIKESVGRTYADSEEEAEWDVCLWALHGDLFGCGCWWDELGHLRKGMSGAENWNTHEWVLC